MLKIAVIGAKDTVLGFKALGLDIRMASSAEEAKTALQELTAEGQEYAIIYIEETLAQYLTAEIARFKDRVTPAVILIPGRDGSIGLGQTALKSAVERAVGTNLLGE